MSNYTIDTEFYIEDEATKSRCEIDFRIVKSIYITSLTNYQGTSGATYYVLELFEPIIPFKGYHTSEICLSEEQFEKFKSTYLYLSNAFINTIGQEF